jgi:hypothetical protein
MHPSLHDYIAKKSLSGPFENQILYRMCAEHPLHKDPFVTSGKVIAIGRIYAASPERGAGKGRHPSQTIFAAVGETLVESNLDHKLEAIGDSFFEDDGVASKVVDLHGYLVDRIGRAITLWSTNGESDDWTPRAYKSFASKYLHFHFPNAFPIMDSFAVLGLRSNVTTGSIDTYAKFCAAMLDHVKSQIGPWSLRGIDTRLVLQGREQS